MGCFVAPCRLVDDLLLFKMFLSASFLLLFEEINWLVIAVSLLFFYWDKIAHYMIAPNFITLRVLRSFKKHK